MTYKRQVRGTNKGVFAMFPRMMGKVFVPVVSVVVVGRLRRGGGAVAAVGRRSVGSLRLLLKLEEIKEYRKEMRLLAACLSINQFKVTITDPISHYLI